MLLLLLFLLCADLGGFGEVRLLLGVTSSITTSVVVLELWCRGVGFVAPTMILDLRCKQR